MIEIFSGYCNDCSCASPRSRDPGCTCKKQDGYE